MLNISTSILCRITPLTLTAVQNGIINKKKLKRTILMALTDAIIVGGLTFFSSIYALGYNDMHESIRISLTSSVATSGLSFFNELRKKKGVIWEKEK